MGSPPVWESMILHVIEGSIEQRECGEDSPLSHADLPDRLALFNGVKPPLTGALPSYRIATYPRLAKLLSLPAVRGLGRRHSLRFTSWQLALTGSALHVDVLVCRMASGAFEIAAESDVCFGPAAGHGDSRGAAGALGAARPF